MATDLFDDPPPGGTTVATVGLPTGSTTVPAEVGDPAPGGVDVVDLDTLDPATSLPDRPDGTVAIVARTLTDLRRATTLGVLLPAARRITITVRQVTSGYTGPPTAGPHWPEVRYGHTATGADGSWSTRLDLAGPLPAGEVLAAVTASLARHWRIPVAQVALAGPGAAHWRPGDAAVRLVPLAGTGPPAPVDLTLRSAPPGTPRPVTGPPVVDRLGTGDQSWRQLARPGGVPRARVVAATLSRPDRLPPFDERTVNPSGFLAVPPGGHGHLVQRGECWTACAAGGQVVPIPPSGAVTDAEVRALRPMRSVAVGWGWHTGPDAAVRALAGLAGAGIPLHTGRVPGWAAALGAELSGLLTSVSAGDLDDDLRREEHSIRLRRAAFRDHSTQARWRQLAAATGVPVPPPARVSVLLLGTGPDRLRFALRQIARQRHVDLEVVLTAPEHLARDATVRAAVDACGRPVTVVPVTGAVPPGAALNRAAAAASGDRLARWRDLDWYGPEYLSDLVMAAHYSGADLVGCFEHLIYLAELDLTVHRPGPDPERADRRIAEGAMLVDRGAFADVGGFRPARAGLVQALQRTLVAAGATVYRTHGLAYMAYRPRGTDAEGVPVTHYLRGTGRQWRGVALAGLLLPESDRAHQVMVEEGTGGAQRSDRGPGATPAAAQRLHPPTSS